MRKMLLVLTICGVVAGPAGTASAATPIATTEARLRAIGVTASDTRLPQTVTEHGLASATNDTCGTPAVSDRARGARVQNWFATHSGGYRTSASVSNELVLYKAGGADALLAEFRTVPKRCPVRTSTVATRTYRLLRTPAALLPGSAFLGIDIRYADGGHEYGVAVAQRFGNVVSLLYVRDSLSYDIGPLVTKLGTLEAQRLRALASRVS